MGAMRRDLLLQHKAIIRQLIQEYEREVGITPALTVTVPLLQAYAAIEVAIKELS